MCGIFGLISKSPIHDVQLGKVERLSVALNHRGPDGSGQISGSNFLLGMHRLSVMGVAKGNQPFWSEDLRFAVLANGEIYNFPSLCKLLERRRFRLSTGSDIEVVPNLIAEFGLEGINLLRGMFALVIYDKILGKVHLVRDRVGEKPLIYSDQSDAFWFSSELTPLIKAGVIAKKLDAAAVEDYLLYGFVPEDKTIIEGVRKVPPGCILTIDIHTGNTEITSYWKALDYIAGKNISTDEIVQSLSESVSISTQSDVPVAVALSGGLDSSLVSALALQSRPDLQGFTVGYTEDTRTDESGAAAQFAQSIGLPLTHVRLDARDVAKDFSTMCAARDEPISDIAGAAYLALARVVHEQGFRVLLSGQGGDELFWGYSWVRDVAQRAFKSSDGVMPESNRRIPHTIPKSARAIIRELETAGGTRINRAFAKSAIGIDSTPNGFPLFEFQPGYRSMLRDRERLLQLRPDKFQGPVSFSHAAEVGPSAIIKLMNTYLRSNGLVQMDRLTMFTSVEARTPLVDHKFVELALSSQLDPSNLFQSPKQALRNAAKVIAPTYDLNRPKMGFTPPIRLWNKVIWQQYQKEIQHPIISESDLFNSKDVHAIIKSPIKWNGQVNQMALRLLTLELWYRNL